MPCSDELSMENSFITLGPDQRARICVLNCFRHPMEKNIFAWCLFKMQTRTCGLKYRIKNLLPSLSLCSVFK